MNAFTWTVALVMTGGVDAVLEVLDWLREGLGAEMGWTCFAVNDARSGGVSET